MKYLVLIVVLLTACARKLVPTASSASDCNTCIVMTEQSQHRILLVDLSSKNIVWQWRADSSNVKPEHVKWFTNPSDAKPVYDRKYVLTTASGGGVALIRIADKKAVFYTRAGVNPHSAELFPDGNIAVASSNDSLMILLRTDTTVAPSQVYQKKVFLEFGHNVVWDAKRGLLWSAAMNKLKSFRYNDNCMQPDVTLTDSIALPGTEAHDLFPVLRQDKLWITNTTKVYTFDVEKKDLQEVPGVGAHIKSITSGKDNGPIITTRPKKSWWTDEVFDTKGNSVFKQTGWKIYKVRWWVENSFSYSGTDGVKTCR